MEFKVSHRFARVSSRKARLVVDLVRGHSVNEALQLLKFTNRRPVRMVEKLIRSAVANAAETNPDIDADTLYVSRAMVDGGPLLGGRLRYKPRSRGMANPIHKRTCHISLWIENREAEPAEREGERAPKARSSGAREGAKEK